MWKQLINQYLSLDKGKELVRKFTELRTVAPVAPDPKYLFSGYMATDYNGIRVVILGDEPYADNTVANGMFMGSLRTDYYENNARAWFNWMKMFAYPTLDPAEFKRRFVRHEMSHLARQGVLMIHLHNSCFVARPGSHRDIGWDWLTKNLLYKLACDHEEKGKPILFVSTSDITQAAIAEAASSFHLRIRIDNPAENLRTEPAALRKETRTLFVGINNFICEHYPHENICVNIQEAINTTVLTGIYHQSIHDSLVPAPCLPNHIEGKFKEKIADICTRMDAQPEAQSMFDLTIPRIIYKRGIQFNYQ